MECCNQNNNSNIPNSVWDIIKQLPFFRYFKQPVDNVSELYERYRDGLEKYTFSYVYVENLFYRWNFIRKVWEPIILPDLPSLFLSDSSIVFEPEGGTIKIIPILLNAVANDYEVFELPEWLKMSFVKSENVLIFTATENETENTKRTVDLIIRPVGDDLSRVLTNLTVTQ